MESGKVSDPTEIDLELIKRWRLPDAEVAALITAVEALRDLVGGLNIDLVNAGHDNEDAVSRAETAEAHAVELAGTLKGLINSVDARNHYQSDSPGDFEGGRCVSLDQARAESAATPPEALERSRARDEVVKWARLVLVDHNAIGAMNDALSVLDALQGEDGT